MDGATSCSWVFVCESRIGPFIHKIPTIWTIYDKKHNCVFSQNRLFDMPKNAPNSSEKQHRTKNFVVRNDEKVARRINATLYSRRSFFLFCVPP